MRIAALPPRKAPRDPGGESVMNPLLRGARPARWILGAILATVLFDAPAQAQGLAASQMAQDSGGWAEVLYVTPKWLVLQNAKGQQFPVSFESIGLFVVRWPSSPADLNGESWIEATGIDVGSNRMRADHIDIYEGAARALVSPAYQQVLGDNRTLSPFDLMMLDPINSRMPLLPGEDQLPSRLHVVGPFLGLGPLRISVFGNQMVYVLPGPAGISMTQITLGSPSFPKKGDLVFLVPVNAGPKTLTLSQLVLYKRIPLNQFVP